MEGMQTYEETAKEQGCYEITQENGYSVHRRFKHGEQTTMTFYNEETGQSYICDEVWQMGHWIKLIRDGVVMDKFKCRTWMIGW